MVSKLQALEERFSAILSSSNAGLWDWRIPENDYFVSARFKLLLGYEPQDEWPRNRESFLEALHPDDRLRVSERLAEHFARRKTYDVEYRLRRKDGAYIWCLAQGQARWNAAGDPIRFSGSAIDITKTKEAERRTKALARELEAVLEHAPVGIAFLRDGRIERYNEAFGGILHLPTVLASADGPAIPFHPVRSARLAEVLHQIGGGRDHGVGDARFLLAPGQPLWISYRLAPLNEEQPEEGVVLVVQDITEQRQNERELEHRALHDSLTELPNRVLFRQSLIQTISQAQRRNWKAAVLFIDVDRFKIVNDTLGHSMGDVLLQMVATRLQTCVRASDTVARLGGDEFGVIVPDLSDTNHASRIATKILDELGKPIRLGTHEVTVAASIGVAMFPQDGRDPEVLISNADAAMYRAKDQGRGQYQYFVPELNHKAARFLELDGRLRKAIGQNEFELAYQPRARFGGGIVGVEALLRWRQGRELIPPSEFVPILEQTGMIVSVGNWVVDTACRDLEVWLRRGIAPISVAINVSAKQFAQRSLVETISSAIARYSICPSQLELEITESSFMDEAAHSLPQLRALKGLGIKVAIDDFGTGYSSLSYLRRFELNTLKIDRSFVKDVISDENAAALTNAIIAMAHKLGISVVAEGVETREQLKWLESAGCDEYQGFILSAGVPAAEVEKMLPRTSSVAPIG